MKQKGSEYAYQHLLSLGNNFVHAWLENSFMKKHMSCIEKIKALGKSCADESHP